MAFKTLKLYNVYTSIKITLNKNSTNTLSSEVKNLI